MLSVPDWQLKKVMQNKSMQFRQIENDEAIFVSPEKNIQFIIKRSKRKTMALSVNAENKVMVRAPLRLSMHEIYRFVDKQKDWIASQLEKQSSRVLLPSLTPQEKEYYREQVRIRAIRILKNDELCPKPKKIFVRYAKTRWGSCSSNGNISLNGYLALLPDTLFHYVLYHEITHLEHMNHSRLFWDTLEERLPRARNLEKQLRLYRIPP